MKILYISPSTIPSRTANAVHVIHQCYALAKKAKSVKLICHTNLNLTNNIKYIIQKDFNLYVDNIEFICLPRIFTKGINFFISIIALAHLITNKNYDIIISRNLYAAFLITYILRKKIIYETHLLEFGIKKFLQFKMINNKNVKLITISNKLKKILESHHNTKIKSCNILHDAASVISSNKIKPRGKVEVIKDYCNINKNEWEMICGYFGHLYPGRGIDIIEEIARMNKEKLFVIVGGNEDLIEQKRIENKDKNIYFAGYFKYVKSRMLMNACDVLLMPYQQKVSLGSNKYETSRWMSPMKMFEYLSSSVPIVSSDLEVLKEVLKNNINSILVKPDNAKLWSKAINRIYNNKEFAENLCKKAFMDYEESYTWKKRAEIIININKQK